MWTFTDSAEPPVVRLKLGQRLDTHLVNGLAKPGEHVSIHWHGIRLPNDQDGVPYLVQPPVEPGESYDYSFVPPDPGTFFFHTHCNTVEQLGRGLMGLLIVEGDETEPYDAERILAVRDWRIDPAGTGFLPFLTLEGAGKSGTFGTVRSVNGVANPSIEVPASADVRLRVLNVDPTRISEIGFEGGEAAVVAIDGLACPPFPLRSWKMGPAMRIDVILRTPADGGSVTMFDYFSAAPVPLARLIARGPAIRQAPFDPAPLAAARIAAPDLGNAETLPFVFSATATGAAIAEASADDAGPLGSLCLSAASLLGDQQAVMARLRHGPPAAADRSHDARPHLSLRAEERHAAHASDPCAWPQLHGAALEQADAAAAFRRYRAAAAERDHRGCLRRRQSRPLDDALPHHRASGDRHDGLVRGRLSMRLRPAALAALLILPGLRAGRRARPRRRQGAVRPDLGRGALLDAGQ